MMRLSISLPSTTLLRPVEISAALPSGFCTAKPPYRVLWALHCAMGNGNFFFDTLNAAGVAEREQIALVAPSLGNGYFINSPFEAQGDFLQEMMRCLREILPLSRQREDNAVLGVSMGGFGAIRWALESGEFKNAASISGVFDCSLPMDERLLQNRALRALHLTFKERMRQMLADKDGRTRTEADLELLLRKAEPAFPHVYLYCGEQDYLSLPHTKELERACTRYNCPVCLRVATGEHDQSYWRNAFQEAVAELFGRANKTA